MSKGENLCIKAYLDLRGELILKVMKGKCVLGPFLSILVI
jgi:hypothetical protein